MYLKYVDLRTKFRRSTIWVGVSTVQSGRLRSLLSLCNTACTVSSIGTLVNSDSTSKNIITLSVWMVSLLIMFANSSEFFTE